MDMEINTREEGPGIQLKRARERLGLTIENVSQELKLHKRLIIAIESDDYSDQKILAPMFIRGYIRNYARFLHVNLDKVMEAFNQLGIFQEEFVLSPSVPTVGTFEQNQKRSLLPFIWVAVLSIALGLGGYFYLNRQVFSQLVFERVVSNFQ